MDFFKLAWATLCPYIPWLLMVLIGSVFAAWGQAIIYAGQMIEQAALNAELKTGQEKMAWVIAQMMAYLPIILRAIVSNEKVRQVCQTIYDTMKGFAITYFSDHAAAQSPATVNNVYNISANGGKDAPDETGE